MISEVEYTEEQKSYLEELSYLSRDELKDLYDGYTSTEVLLKAGDLEEYEELDSKE